MINSDIKKKLIKTVKKILHIPQNKSLSLTNYFRCLRLRYGPIIYRTSITTQDIIDIMVSLGVRKGSTVLIHSSWDEMYNFQGTEKELIEAILKLIGNDGTLVMPAFPLLRKGKVFNVSNTVSSAGLLPETFRQYPGVKRSINVEHSVCALGPMSDFLLSEHHLGETAWDEKSPYFKLGEIEALIISIGLGKYYIGTTVHCVESLLRLKYTYFASLFDTYKKAYEYIDDKSGIVKNYYNYPSASNRKNKFYGTSYITKRYFSKEWHSVKKISNLLICRYYSKQVIDRMIEIGESGEVLYRTPSTKGFKFSPKSHISKIK